MKRYRDDKFYLLALFGWGWTIASVEGRWRVGAIVIAILGIVLHRVNQRPPRTDAEGPKVVGLDPADPMAQVIRETWKTGKIVTWNERDGLRTFDDPRDGPTA